MELTILVLLLITFPLIFITFVVLILTYFFGIDFQSKIKNVFHHRKKDVDEYNKMLAFVAKLTAVLVKMSIDKVGALIVVEKNENLNQYIHIGTKIESDFSPELIYSIFYNKKSPLHDGAIIVRDWKIVSVSSYLPTSKKIINVQYGARHRAAFGITEKFDCFAFVVSETNGKITGVHLDETIHLSSSSEKLSDQLIKMFATSNHTLFERFERSKNKKRKAQLEI